MGKSTSDPYLGHEFILDITYDRDGGLWERRDSPYWFMMYWFLKSTKTRVEPLVLEEEIKIDWEHKRKVVYLSIRV